MVCYATFRAHQWINEVLAFGYAYGAKSALAGKKCLHVVTTGSPSSYYSSGARNNFSLSEILRPQQQTALYCGMEWLPVFALQGMLNSGTGKPITDEELEKKP